MAALQGLLGTDAVNGKLQRTGGFRRAAQLVVDDAERPILEQIDPIGLPPDADRSRSARPLEFKRAFERLLEEALEHRDLLFDLEVERPLAQTWRDRRAEEIRTLERAVRLAEVRERRLGN